METTSYVYVAASEYVTARLRQHWGRHRLRPADLATVICQVSALLKPGTGLYGRLAWPWTMKSPMLRQRVFIYIHFSFTLCEFLPRPTAAAGNYAYACHCRTLTPGVTSPWRPEASSLWRRNCLFSSSCWLRLGDTRPGPRLNFSLLRLGSPTDVILTLRRWLTSFICTTYRDHLLHLTAIVIVVIVTVRPLFKRNFYLSLLYVIGLLLSKN